MSYKNGFLTYLPKPALQKELKGMRNIFILPALYYIKFFNAAKGGVTTKAKHLNFLLLHTPVQLHTQVNAH